MADILIRGMEMPKDDRITIQIGADGAVYFVEEYTILAEKYEKSSHATPLPEGHGRIVDAAEILEKANNSPWFDGDVSELGLLLGSEVTTIVPAEVRMTELKLCPCDTCIFSPPSSGDGKPCCACDTDDPLSNCYQRRTDND